MGETGLNSNDESNDSLPSELSSAIERARMRTASPAQIAKLAERVLEMTSQHSVPSPVEIKKANSAGVSASVYWLCTIAASIGLIVLFRPWASTTDNQAEVPKLVLSQPIYSPITTVSLSQVGYRQIEVDLDRADAKLAEASEGLALAAVRYEIQQTLEEFYDWRK